MIRAAQKTRRPSPLPCHTEVERPLHRPVQLIPRRKQLLLFRRPVKRSVIARNDQFRPAFQFAAGLLIAQGICRAFQHSDYLSLIGDRPRNGHV